MPETLYDRPVLLDINDGIALLTLNRPEKLNALSYALIDRLMARSTRSRRRRLARVILTGAGERAFSAGADIQEFSESVSTAPNGAYATSSGAARR